MATDSFSARRSIGASHTPISLSVCGRYLFMGTRHRVIIPVIVRFSTKFKINKSTGCWEWTGAKNEKGYGTIWGGPGSKIPLKAHRLAYEFFNGAIPEGLEIDHVCKNRACVNPSHLEAVDHRTNILRGTGPQALNAKKTHCPYGHPYIPENMYTPIVDGRPVRQCKTCVRKRQLEAYHRKRQVKLGESSSSSL